MDAQTFILLVSAMMLAGVSAGLFIVRRRSRELAAKHTALLHETTERRQVERDLRESEELKRRILEALPCAVVQVTADGAIVFSNLEAQRFSGLSAAELRRRHIRDFGPQTIWEDGSPCPPDLYPVMQCLRTGETQPTVTIGLRREDGRTVWGMFSAVPLMDTDNVRISGAIATFLDVTHRREVEQARAQLEEQLRQVQKLESIGRLAGGVAHDFNNLLTAILGHAGLADQHLQPGHPARNNLEQIKRTANGAAKLTGQLLAFARRQIAQPRPVNVNDLALHLDEMLRRLIGEDVTYVMSPASNLWNAKADAGQMEQVLMNLVVNARDAMPDGGVLTIETANVVVRADDERRPKETPPGEYVTIAVRDTGVGMSDEVQRRIFEPFFTTKDEGTGLGLATCYGIVLHAGGQILLESAPGRGTTFTVYLPRATDGPAPTLQSVVDSAAVGAPPTGRETVLLAEDEEHVREVAVQALRGQGYTVIAAPNGREALALAARDDKRIDLLLTDVIMPVMGGKELANELRRVRPSCKVLFMSGYTDSAIGNGGGNGDIAFLQKPFTPTMLAHKVREVLDSAKAAPAPGGGDEDRDRIPRV